MQKTEAIAWKKQNKFQNESTKIEQKKKRMNEKDSIKCRIIMRIKQSKHGGFIIILKFI